MSSDNKHNWKSFKPLSHVQCLNPKYKTYITLREILIIYIYNIVYIYILNYFNLQEPRDAPKPSIKNPDRTGWKLKKEETNWLEPEVLYSLHCNTPVSIYLLYYCLCNASHEHQGCLLLCTVKQVRVQNSSWLSLAFSLRLSASNF